LFEGEETKPGPSTCRLRTDEGRDKKKGGSTLWKKEKKKMPHPPRQAQKEKKKFRIYRFDRSKTKNPRGRGKKRRSFPQCVLETNDKEKGTRSCLEVICGRRRESASRAPRRWMEMKEGKKGRIFLDTTAGKVLIL